MRPPEIPANEPERLAALAEYEIVDTPAEPGFDALTALAAELLGVPVALISIVDADRQWFKSRYGLEAPETPREFSFCGHVVAAEQPLVVADAHADERFADNPLVTGEPRVRFYAGAPLRTSDGYVLGTLCAIDHEPRRFSERQQELLAQLARQAVDLLELRRQHRLLSEERAVTRRHRMFFELSLELLCTVDSSFRFRELNPAWHRVVGWSLAELRAGAFFDFLHPDDLEATRREASRLLEDSSPTVGFENRFRHKEGRWVTLSWAVAFDDGIYFASARDVTVLRSQDAARAASERAARDNELRLAAIFDSAVDAILTIDSRGLVRRSNPAVERLFGYRREQIEGENVRLLMTSPDRERHDGYLARYLETGEARVIGIGREVTCRRQDGSTFEAELTVSEYQLGGERLFTGILRDLTERKRIERLQAEFVSTVSHELRTPLTSIRGSLGLIAGGSAGELPQRARGLVEIAHRNIERLSRLVDDILDIQKIEAGRIAIRYERVDLAALARQTVATSEAVAGSAGVRLELEIAPELPAIVGDEDRVTQVLTNLLSNAIKYSPGGGRVRVLLVAAGAAVRVEVADEGPGVPPDFADRIFGRFQQADTSDTRERGGTGLGLNIAKALVERQGGRIGYRTREGGGSVFFFELPRFEAFAEAESPRSGRPRVLVCEDDPDLAQLLRLMLAEGGLEAVVAETAAEARRRLGEEPFAAMTLDLLLPDHSGLDLLRELRAAPATADLPVVVVSACAEEGRAALEGAGLAVVAWLDKPIDHGRLLAALRRGLQGGTGALAILHVEDDGDTRQMLADLVADLGEVVGARDLAEARRRMAERRFDLIVLDLGLPDGSGVALLVDLAELGAAAPPVVVFSGREPNRDVERRVQAVLVKGRASNEEIVRTLRRLVRRGATVAEPTESGR